MRIQHPPLQSFASRRSCLRAGGAALAAALVGLASSAVQAQAQAAGDWPQKQIRLVVPYAPGGSADTLGRLIAKHLGEAFKQPVVVENKGGAGGMIGSHLVAKAPPDGYTLVVSGIGSHVIAPVESPGTFDPMKDFTHIALLGGPPIAMVVNAEQPIADFKGFISYVSQQPKGLSWASPGQGTHGYLTGETFRNTMKLNMVHIAYKGAGPAVADLIANQVPAAFMTLSSANAHVNSGKLRLLAVTSPQRLPEFPNVPTFAELGYPNLTGTTWFAVSGPAGMPQAIVDKINAEVRRGLQTPAARKQMALESMVAGDYDAAGFTRFVASEIERWGPAARSLAVKSK
ncbi:MAG: tripartite tricarboxylate transporter substrate binding protein [Ramlibacter sp.]|jgi:tripartite-type tricarboxylate transporter receptor subunit TctC|nr:tripartite tricarboxylate transporter substrate binding protein [Ramlibacter sp.]